MILSRRAAFFAILSVLFVVLIAGCGDTFRPIAIPLPVPAPDPQAPKQAIVLSPNGGVTPGTGSATHIDLAGESIIGQVTVGTEPVHAATFLGNARVMVANRGDNTVTVHLVGNPLATLPTVVSLPAGAFAPSAPGDLNPKAYLFTNQPAQNMFVAMSGLDQVGVVNLGSNLFITGIPVAGTPVALVGSSDGNRLYSANANGTVSVIDARNFVEDATVAVGADPAHIVISSDSQFVYVVNRGSGTVSRITAGTNAVTTITVGTAPNYAFFDPRLLRVYVANTGSNSVSIINADPLAAGFGQVTNVNVGSSPRFVTALADGSKAYVSNAGSGTVSVISSLSNTVLHTVTVGAAPEHIVSSTDSTKVAVLNRSSNSVSTIRASDDAVTATISVPASPVYMNLSQ
jgi:YVTN family beta-propeller protein